MLARIIEKRKIVVLFFIMFLALGTITFFQLPSREIPEVDPPFATITTIYPGATPEQVDKYVTQRIETKISTIPEIEEVRSTSSANISNIIVQIKEDIPSDPVWNILRQRLKEAESLFPEGVNEPSLNTDLQMQGIALYQLVAQEPAQLQDLHSFLERWNNRFTQHPGIARVNIQGLAPREILLILEAEKMRALNITWQQVMGALNSELGTLPPGKWEAEQRSYPVNLERVSNIDDLSNIPIMQQSGSSPVKIRDIARVDTHYTPDEEIVYYQGQPAISLSFFITPGSDIFQLDRELSALIAQMETELPPGIEVVQVYSQAHPVKDLFFSLGIAFLLAILVVLLVSSSGLNKYTAASVALAIPISISMGIIALPYVGVDLNQISLIAFIIVLGILVDDAIVVNENIERRLCLGDDPLQAVCRGTRGVAVSVITSTVVIVFTFFPLLFLTGGSGSFIRPLPAIIISSIIASTLVALFLVPVYRFSVETRIREKMSARPPSGWLDRPLEALTRGYALKLIPLVLKKPGLVAVAGLLISFSAYALIPFIPLEFFPDADREEVFLEMSLPESVLLAETSAETDRVKEWLRQEFPGIREINTFIGTSIPRLFGMTSAASVGPNTSSMLMYVDREIMSAAELSETLNRELPAQFPRLMVTASVIESGPPIGAPLALRIQGEDNETLQKMAAEVKNLLADQEGVEGISDDAGRPLASIRFAPRREAMEELGVNNRQLSEAIRLFGEGLPAGELELEQSLVDLRIKYGHDRSSPLEGLNAISVVSARGENVPLSAIASIDTEFSVQNLSRFNYLPAITVRGYTDSQTDADQVLSALKPGLDELSLAYPGYSIIDAGETAARTEVFIEIGKIFLVVIFLVLIVMAIQFNSLTLPLLIFITVILSTSGALFSLFFTQTGLGFMSMMGVISLAGIVVRNGIILVEFMEINISRAMSAVQAIQLACAQRMRPILLTSFTSFFGLMPLALGQNPLFKPLAIAIAGGLIFSTMLTLILIPVFYKLYLRLYGLGGEARMELSDDAICQVYNQDV